ncbi:MAG TPA: hypothetical protein VFZ74_14250, partial [Burkholderiales bacterium]
VKDWASEWPFVAWSVITASVGVVCLAGSLFGWLFGFALAWHRVLLFVAAMLLIKPGLITDTVGIVLLGIVAAAQILARRRLLEAGGAVAGKPGG